LHHSLLDLVIQKNALRLLFSHGLVPFSISNRFRCDEAEGGIASRELHY